MANNKIDRINKEIAKTREKITEYQNKLKGLEAQKTEAENLEIVQLVRAMRLTPQELNAMLSGGGIPGCSLNRPARFRMRRSSRRKARWRLCGGRRKARKVRRMTRSFWCVCRIW